MAFFSKRAGRRLFTVKYLLLFRCNNCRTNTALCQTHTNLEDIYDQRSLKVGLIGRPEWRCRTEWPSPAASCSQIRSVSSPDQLHAVRHTQEIKGLRFLGVGQKALAWSTTNLKIHFYNHNQSGWKDKHTTLLLYVKPSITSHCGYMLQSDPLKPWNWTPSAHITLHLGKQTSSHFLSRRTWVSLNRTPPLRCSSK